MCAPGEPPIGKALCILVVAAGLFLLAGNSHKAHHCTSRMHPTAQRCCPGAHTVCIHKIPFSLFVLLFFFLFFFCCISPAAESTTVIFASGAHSVPFHSTTDKTSNQLHIGFCISFFDFSSRVIWGIEIIHGSEMLCWGHSQHTVQRTDDCFPSKISIIQRLD